MILLVSLETNLWLFWRNKVFLTCCWFLPSFDESSCGHFTLTEFCSPTLLSPPLSLCFFPPLSSVLPLFSSAKQAAYWVVPSFPSEGQQFFLPAPPSGIVPQIKSKRLSLNTGICSPLLYTLMHVNGVYGGLQGWWDRVEISAESVGSEFFPASYSVRSHGSLGYFIKTMCFLFSLEPQSTG